MRSMISSRYILVALALFILAGSGCEVGTVIQDGGVDGSAMPDGGIPPDGGQKPDGGIFPDAGPLPDGGVTPDGGPDDGGQPPDGGPVDGGIVDGGLPDGNLDDGGQSSDGSSNPDSGGEDGSIGDGGITDGSLTDGGTTPDAGSADGGWLNPDASYWFDGGQCGDLNKQCCEGGKCIFGYNCQGGTCKGTSTDGGVTDGGPKPDAGMPDSGYDGGMCGFLGAPCCGGNLCYEGYCWNGLYCAPIADGGTTDGGGSDGGVTDAGSADSGHLAPDASYYFDGGLCGDLNQQCCQYSKCIDGYNCQGGKCKAPVTDGGAFDGSVTDGGVKPDGSVTDGSVTDGGISDVGIPDGGPKPDGGSADGGSCGALYQVCCPGYQCNKGVCNGIYCAPPQDGGLDGGGTCGALGQPCCAAFQCYSPLLCDGYVCFQLDGGTGDGGASDGSVTDGGVKPDGGGSDGGVSDGGSTDGGVKPDGGGSADGGCTPVCTGKCGGAPNGCGGTCTAACPEGENCQAQACVPCGAVSQPCCDNGAACEAVEPALYCYSSKCQPLPICDVSPTFLGGEMCLVPTGPFSMGCSKEDKECAKDESPLHDPVLSEYWIDRNEVTVTEFEQCVKSEVCAVPKAKAPTCNYGVTGRDKFPMNCIEWKQAQAYCGWVLKALPTEAQWEKAARGLNSWIYPWGDAPPASCLLAIMYDAGMGGAGCGTGTTWPVGTMDTESPYGALDMAGNVWEWAYDWYDSAYYLSSPAIDPQGPADGTAKVVRGGGFDTDSAANMRTSKRGAIDPSLVLDNTGFRCAFTKLK